MVNLVRGSLDSPLDFFGNEFLRMFSRMFRGKRSRRGWYTGKLREPPPAEHRKWSETK